MTVSQRHPIRLSALICVFATVVLLMLALGLAKANIAAAGEVEWSCNVAPQSWCEYPVARDYYANDAVAQGVTGWSVQTKIIFSWGNEGDIDADWGVSCPSCSVGGVGLIGYYQTSSSYPLVYNADAYNYVTIIVYSDYA